MRMGAQCFFTLLCVCVPADSFVDSCVCVYSFSLYVRQIVTTPLWTSFLFDFVSSSSPPWNHTNEDSFSTCWVAAFSFKLRCQFIVSPDTLCDGSLGENRRASAITTTATTACLLASTWNENSFFISFFSEETHERNKPPMGLIYSQGVDLVLSILILFYFITSFERERERERKWKKWERNFFSPSFFFLDEFHSVKATWSFQSPLLFPPFGNVRDKIGSIDPWDAFNSINQKIGTK